MDKVFLSLLCIANDQKIYDGFIESLKTQKFSDYELIPIMNMHGEYDGARSAFNKAASGAKGEYLVFIHPDIRFESEESLGDIAAQIIAAGDFGVLGAAGAAPNERGDRDIFTTIVHGDKKEKVGIRIEKAVPVQTVDECLFIVSSSYFKEHPFSEKKGWHLYGVEYCLDAIAGGKENKVIPSKIWHLSDGKSLNKLYLVQLEELIREKKNRYDMICTTVKAWKTRGAGPALYRKYYYVKQSVKKLLIK